MTEETKKEFKWETIWKQAKVTENGKKVSLVDVDLDHIPSELYSTVGSEVTWLDLSNNLITDTVIFFLRSKIENIDRFVNLKTLVLDNNSIEDVSGLLQGSFKELETLWLNHNNIQDVEPLLNILENKQKFPKLNYLSLMKNPGCPSEFGGLDSMDDYQRFRFYVLYRLKNLKFFDARQISASERKEADKKGQFCKVVKAVVNTYSSTSNNNSNDNLLLATEDTPANKQQVSNSESVDSTQTYFGYTKHVYTGKHSEGNRFIRNDDL